MRSLFATGRPRTTPLWILAGALLAATGLPAPASAQGRIEAVRLGRSASFQRIVLDVTTRDVPAYVTPDREELQVEAAPPVLEPRLARELAALGVRIEPSPGGTRLRLDPALAPSWVAFRLETGDPRIVIDLGAGRPGVPPDATALTERAAAAPGRDEPARPTDRTASLPPESSPRPLEDDDPAARSPDASLEALLDPPDAEPSPATPDVAAPAADPFRVEVSDIRFSGLPAGGPTTDELLDLRLMVRRGERGDWESAPQASDARAMSLRQLASSEADAPALRASVLQTIVERIASVYLERGRAGTRIDIRRSDLAPLLEKRGTLIVHVSAPEESNGSK